MASTPIQLLADQAEKAYRAGKFTQAAELYRQAAENSAASDDALTAAELANNRSVALLRSGDAHGALLAALETDTIFEQAGDVRRQAFAIGNQAAAYEALGQNDKALACFQQSADLLKITGDSENRSSVLKSISALQVRSGSHLEALASMDAALQNQPKLSLKERFLKKLLHMPIKMLNRG